MATVSFFTGPAGLVAPGASVDFTAVLAVSPGETDQTLTAELRDHSGVVRGSTTVVIDRPDPEADPVLAVSEAPGVWSIRVVDDQGVAVGNVAAVLGTRDTPATYTAAFTWTAPA